MRSTLANIKYEEVKHNIESENLSEKYLKGCGLSQKSKNDASHIAVATVNSCNAIVSWNFKHMVNLRAITAVDAVNIKEGY
ncbi:hypothetical protein AGMMS50233_06560 [Endomicrobiia bacterium]|nr:hypothetical protein AGMMS50233_06560 [Endomicrobiia bacterium]